MRGVRARASSSANRPRVVKAAAPSVRALKKTRRLEVRMGFLIRDSSFGKRVLVVPILERITNQRLWPQGMAAAPPGEKRQRQGGGTRSPVTAPQPLATRLPVGR